MRLLREVRALESHQVDTARRVSIIALILALSAIAVGLAACVPQPPPTPAPTSGAVTVYVWDVGEALSVLIDDDNTEILIDAGNDRDGAVLADKIAPCVADGTLEYVIATHSHADHIGGLEDIYAAYQVAHTIYGDTGTSQQFKEFMDAASAEPNSIVLEDGDEVIRLPEGASLTILDILDGDTNTNNNSVITVLEVSGRKMLVTGDAEDEKSRAVRTTLVSHLQDERLYPIDIYLVGHHGSETSSSAELLSLIQPSYAIISSEGPSGRYHNPDITVIERLTAVDATIFSTYRSGDIVISFEQDGIRLSPPQSERISRENYQEAP